MELSNRLINETLRQNNLNDKMELIIWGYYINEVMNYD